MSVASFLRRVFLGDRATRPGPPRRQFTPQAKYDAAQTGVENQNHWANADALSATAANSPEVRHKLRTRARYEYANNGYCHGLLNGHANDVVGCGPRLQFALPEAYTDADFDRPAATPAGLDRAVELLWQEWADAIGLADKLRLMDLAKNRDGEVFALLVTNPALPAGMPQLDLKVIEADQVCTPNYDPTGKAAVDGIEFDAAGNPAFYHVLKRHPGDTIAWVNSPYEYDRVPASQVVHLFDRRRPGQARGVPTITPSLPLFSQLRRLTLANLGASEIGAMIAGVIESEHPGGGDDDPVEIEAMDQVPFARNALLTLHNGMKAKAFDNGKPLPGYKEFKGEILTEAGRPLCAPRNVSTGSSAEYNYSSGRLDHLPYQRALRIDRDQLRCLVLDRVHRAWADEAAAIPGYLPAGLPPRPQWRSRWQWDGWESIDPLKDAKANETLLASGQTTLMRVCAERGEDWEEVLEQQAREAKKRKSLGLPEPGAVAAEAPAPEEEEAAADA